MARTPEQPPVTLTAQDRQDFARDGVICVRGLYSPQWVDRLTTLLDDICKTRTPFGSTDDKFRNDAYLWQIMDPVRDFVLFGPSAPIAQQAFGSSKVNFFYDQVFIKAQMTPDPTPWHHDFTFWPLAGDQIASIWTSVDPVTTESSGLEFVAGSHLWPQRFKAVGVGGTVLSTAPLDDIPDIDGDRSRFDILSWDLEPGDALLFHALTLHGARGNRSRMRKRRAIVTRWCGDDVTYQAQGQEKILPWEPGLQTGDPLSGYVFPQVLPEIDEAAIARRMAGPIFPEPQRVAQLIEHVSQLERVPVKMDDLGLVA